MIKILHSADWHILLHKKKVPFDWQYKRFEIFFDKLLELEKNCHAHIIAGDLFDKKPEEDEVCLALTYLNRVTIPTFIIPGNHEATKRGQSFLESFRKQYVINNKNVEIFTKNTRIEWPVSGEPNKLTFQFFPYGEMQIDNLPNYITDDILVTHIRGEVPPHITAEYDFEKLKQWKLILCGDLHFAHQYKNYPAYYPGSPMNVSFDRDESREYGVYTIDFNSINDYKVNFIDLKLPKLIRKTITTKDQMISDSYNHVIYEVVGSLDELSDVVNHELLDKKIAHKPKEGSKLELQNKTLAEELIAWLDFMKIDEKTEILKEFSNLGIS